MTPNEYQKLCMRTAYGVRPGDFIENGAMGLCGESGEVIDLVKKSMFQGHMLDCDKIAEELGDVLWYAAMLCEGICIDMESVMARNIEKLKKRYPNGFESERSVNRYAEKKAGD